MHHRNWQLIIPLFSPSSLLLSICQDPPTLSVPQPGEPWCLKEVSQDKSQDHGWGTKNAQATWGLVPSLLIWILLSISRLLSLDWNMVPISAQRRNRGQSLEPHGFSCPGFSVLVGSKESIKSKT